MKKFCILPPECTYVICAQLVKMKSDYRHTELIDSFLLDVKTECAYCRVPNEYLTL